MHTSEYFFFFFVFVFFSTYLLHIKSCKENSADRRSPWMRHSIPDQSQEEGERGREREREGERRGGADRQAHYSACQPKFSVKQENKFLVLCFVQVKRSNEDMCSGGSGGWDGEVAQRCRERSLGKHSSEDSSHRDVKSGASHPGGLPGPDLLIVY